MSVDDDQVASEMWRRVLETDDAGEEFERIIRRVYEAVLQPGDVAFDAGAHVGKHSLPMLMAVAPAGTVVALDPVDGHPTFTFTAPTPPEQRPPAAPSAPYLATILHGLREVHDLDDTDIVERVGQSPGVRPNWSPAAMHQLLDTPLSEISST